MLPVGAKRWVNPKFPIMVWDGPPKPGQLGGGTGTGTPTTSGSFTVVRHHFDVLDGYIIQFENGKEGYTSDSLTLTDDEAAHRKILAEKAACERKGGVAVGMTKDQVRASCWGKPQNINTTVVSGLRQEQWVYPGYNYVYFHNGIVRAVQTSK